MMNKVPMMKTSIEDLERTKDKPDPWGYQTNPADIERKSIIIDRIHKFVTVPFMDVLDIGCGEGWITKDLPFTNIYGSEVSTQAKARWDSRIIDWAADLTYQHRQFDLVMATGVMYENYRSEAFVSFMDWLDPSYILTCNIAGREYWPAIEQIKGKLIHLEEFPYHRGPDEMFTQRIRIYRR